jgi:hypothetical protein
VLYRNSHCSPDSYCHSPVVRSLPLVPQFTFESLPVGFECEPGTNVTVAAGMLFPPTELVKPEYNDFAI